jgi:hypothetical protein
VDFLPNFNQPYLLESGNSWFILPIRENIRAIESDQPHPVTLAYAGFAQKAGNASDAIMHHRVAVAATARQVDRGNLFRGGFRVVRYPVNDNIGHPSLS